MNKRFIGFSIGFLFPLIILGQSTTGTDCNKIRYGSFYFYSADSQNEFLIVRKDLIQEEINLKTGDTSFCKVNWKNDCAFDLRFIRESQPMPDDKKLFFNSHITAFKILKVTKNYYVFKAGLDSVNNSRAVTDTVWFNAR